MKLVEILARDLKVWPKNNNGNDGITQDRGGRLNSLDTGCEPSFNEEDKCWESCSHSYLDGRLEEAEDYATSVVTRKMWQAERDRQKGGEWKRHRGGKMPVADEVRVEVKLRDGDIQEAEASAFLWYHSDCDVCANIMQYRVISQPQAEEVEVKDTTTGTLSYKVEIDTSAATQAIDELAAKWDQVDGPLLWRDQIVELEAHAEDIQREIASLHARLTNEGFQLIRQYPSLSTDVPAVDMSDWRNWKAGDVVESREKEEDIHIGEYYVLTEDVDAEDGEVYFNDSNGDDRHRDANKYRFISRP